MDFVTQPLPQIIRRSDQSHRLLCSLIQRLRDAKICQLEYSFFIDEDILRLDVSMDDLMLMQILHAKRKLYKKIHDKRFLEVLVVFLSILDVNRQISIYMRVVLHSQYSITMISISS